ncbi:DUF6090 family protein [Namhaeicola litoreus]|uniref:DUF6090 family protein n=1 Tax=Namhaeicola litoreus TaxID=1052145 RepID=A0ABW3XYL5_9FLAO
MRNYFKYALGEIILVVLGILIALQVNNWNEDRKKLHEEKSIIEGLKSEFESAKKEIIADIEDRNKSIQVVISTLERHTGKNLTKIPQDSVKYFLDELMQYRFYTPSHPVLDDLQSSGRFNLIKSEELRFLIRDYIQTKERIKMPEEKERRFVLEQMAPFLSERIALGKLFESDQYELDREKLDHLMNDEFFGSLLYIRKNTIKSSQQYSRILLKNIETIQFELNKNLHD